MKLRQKERKREGERERKKVPEDKESEITQEFRSEQKRLRFRERDDRGTK